jgi:hypothetical protein
MRSLSSRSLSQGVEHAVQGAFSGTGAVCFRVRYTCSKGVFSGVGQVPKVCVRDTPYPCAPAARLRLAALILFFGSERRSHRSFPIAHSK